MLQLNMPTKAVVSGALALEVPVNEPELGIFKNIENEAYHASKGISSSGLKMVLTNPKEYQHSYIEKAVLPKGEHFKIGEVVHLLALEPEKIAGKLVEMPKFTGEGSRGARADFLEEHSDKFVLTATDYAMVMGVYDSIQKHSIVSNFIQKSEVENSIYWMERENILSKARLDAWRPDISVIGDLKTSVSANPNKFRYDVYKYGYHLSAAWYERAVEAQTGNFDNEWVWIVIGKTAPYSISVIRADESMISEGRKLYNRALDRYQSCLKTNEWPSYSGHVETFKHQTKK